MSADFVTLPPIGRATTNTVVAHSNNLKSYKQKTTYAALPSNKTQTKFTKEKNEFHDQPNENLGISATKFATHKSIVLVKATIFCAALLCAAKQCVSIL